MLAFLLVVDLWAVRQSYDNPGDKTSHAAHFGGYIAGTVAGIVIGVNHEVKKSEQIFKAFSLVVGFSLVVICIVWMATVWPPQTFWESEGWCFRRQVWSWATWNTTDLKCIECTTLECVARYNQPDCSDCVTYAPKDKCDSFISG